MELVFHATSGAWQGLARPPYLNVASVILSRPGVYHLAIKHFVLENPFFQWRSYWKETSINASFSSKPCVIAGG